MAAGLFCSCRFFVIFVTMSHSLTITNKHDKAAIYQELLPQLESVIADETDLIANLANTTAMLKEAFNWFWVGFYIVQGSQLVLGPFQGTIACTRIKKGRGVCGTAWESERTIVVNNVDEFPDHIACSSASRSEIVIPLMINNKVVGVIDVDSDQLSAFDEIDSKWLNQLCRILEKMIERCKNF